LLFLGELGTKKGGPIAMKILIATDGSTHSTAMVKEFARRTFAPRTKVRIVSAYDSSLINLENDPIMGPLTTRHEAAVDLAERRAIDAARSAAALFQKRQPDLNISHAAIEGAAKRVILQAAERFGADLIVVGSHGHGAVAGFLLGSVSQAVAMHATCSVEIVRAKKSNR